MHASQPTDVDDGSRDVTNLFEVYGAVDHHLEENEPPDETERVSLMLPVYRRSDTHWFQDFAKKTRLAEQYEIGPPRSRVSEALKAFSESKPRSRMRARRLYAAGVAASAFPDLSARELAAGALGAEELDSSPDPDERAERLATLFRRDPETDTHGGRDAWWDGLLGSGLIPAASGVGPRPASGSLSWVKGPDGDEDLVPTLKTVFESPLAFDAAKKFCYPVNWKCYPSWCGMDLLGEENGIERYQETVSFGCHNPDFPKITVDLNFTRTFSDGPQRVALAEYWLSEDQPFDNVTVNQGWLEIVELQRPPYPKVRVTTTKTVKFRDDMGGPGMAVIANRVGYVSMVEDLVVCASKGEGEEGYPDVPIRGRYLPADTGRTRRGPSLNAGALIDLMVEEATVAAENGIDEFTKAQDMGDYWIGMFRQGARLADAGRRVAQTAPSARAPNRTRGER